MLSIIVSIYSAVEYIVDFHAALARTLGSIELETSEAWEVIYVTPADRGPSLSLGLNIYRDDPRVVLVEQSRNFWYEGMMTAGLKLARGEAIIIMGFQDPPEVLPKMVHFWKSGARAVIAERTNRADCGIRDRGALQFNRITSWLSAYPISLSAVNAGMFGLLDRQAADALLELNETHPYLHGPVQWFPIIAQHEPEANSVRSKNNDEPMQPSTHVVVRVPLEIHPTEQNEKRK